MTPSSTRAIHIASFSLLFALAGGCGGDEEADSHGSTGAQSATPAAPEAPAEPEGPVFRTTMMGMEMTEPLVTKPLGVEGFEGLTIVAPEQATIELRDESATVRSAGVNYSIAIRHGALDAAATQRIWGIIDPNGSVVEEADDLLIYQRSNDGGMLFEAGVSVDDQAYTCSTVVTAVNFTREQIDQMVTSCRTLAAAGS